MKALLGHCLYRRVVIWTVVLIVLLSITLFNPKLTARSHDVFDLVHGSRSRVNDAAPTPENLSLQKQDDEERPPDLAVQETKQDEEEPKQEGEEEEQSEEKDKESEDGKASGPHWLRYKQ